MFPRSLPQTQALWGEKAPRLAGCPLPGHGAPIRERDGERKGRAYRPPGRRAALRVPGGPKTPQERIAEACGRSWGVLSAGQGAATTSQNREQHLRVGGPNTAEGPAPRAPPTYRPLAPGP